jgi:nicotinamide phosphoribosyltransferase
MRMLSALMKDGYKCGHPGMLKPDITEVHENFTPRAGRDATYSGVVSYGNQYYQRRYLIEHFGDNFFAESRSSVEARYSRRMKNYLGIEMSVSHIGALHELGFIPLEIRAIPEGSFVPYGVPTMTNKPTVDGFAWVPGMVETIMSCTVWPMSTSATTARRYRQTIERYSSETVGEDNPFRHYQCHDFSFRGMFGFEAAMMSGSAHALFFRGSDTLPAMDFLVKYYDANEDTDAIATSVHATEHQIMMLNGDEEDELTTISDLLDGQPEGILAIVSDTWDYWRNITVNFPALKDKIMSRNGKMVCRPDSGDPVKIVIGDPEAPYGTPESKGTIRCLAETFGSAPNGKGYLNLDPHIGVIYGEAITPERQDRILAGLKAMNFSSDNILFGTGSYAYQGVTRDTHGWAVKPTAGRSRSRGLFPVQKNPKTDDGTKKSAKGLLRVDRVDGVLTLRQGVTEEEADGGELRVTFRDGKEVNPQSFNQIRAIVEAEL